MHGWRTLRPTEIVAAARVIGDLLRKARDGINLSRPQQVQRPARSRPDPR
jgi:hypothetical protein